MKNIKNKKQKKIIKKIEPKHFFFSKGKDIQYYNAKGIAFFFYY